MRTWLKLSLLTGMVSGICFSAKAQDSLIIQAKTDFISNYVWRGSDQNSGFSVQPYLTIAFKGINFTINGSQSLTNSESAPQEFDLNVGYSYRGLSLTLSDYWWEGMKAPYGHYLTGHHFEATAAWSMADLCKVPLNLSWSTWFAGFDDYKSDVGGGLKRAFSTYLSVSFNISMPSGITLTPAIGVTPWEGVYHHKAAITDLSLKADKSLKVTDHFSIPFFVQAIVAPHDTAKGVDKTYLVAGFSLGF